MNKRSKFASDKDKTQFCHELTETFLGAAYVADDAKIAQRYVQDPHVRKQMESYYNQLESIEHSSKKLLKHCGCEDVHY